MTIAIMQPTFNPWLGYFDLIDYVDLFVFLDIVQLQRRSWQVRNKLKVNNKEYTFTLPIKKESKREHEILHTVKFDQKNYMQEKLYKLLQLSYRKSCYFDVVDPFIKDLIFYDTYYLTKYTINMIQKIAQKIGISTDFVTLSETDFVKTSSKGDLIFDICKYFGTDKYVAPKGSRVYLNYYIDTFKKNSIELFYQNYKHPTYRQLGNIFISHMGIIDLLYNEGFERALPVIRAGRCYEKVQL